MLVKPSQNAYNRFKTIFLQGDSSKANHHLFFNPCRNISLSKGGIHNLSPIVNPSTVTHSLSEGSGYSFTPLALGTT